MALVVRYHLSEGLEGCAYTGTSPVFGPSIIETIEEKNIRRESLIIKKLHYNNKNYKT